MMEIKGIFFDMDGVLIDVKDWYYEVLNCVLYLFGMIISWDEYLLIFDGLLIRDKFNILIKFRGLF